MQTPAITPFKEVMQSVYKRWFFLQAIYSNKQIPASLSSSASPAFAITTVRNQARHERGIFTISHLNCTLSSFTTPPPPDTPDT